MSLDELYQELILEHFRNPRFRGDLADCTHRNIVYNPLCGDKIEVGIFDGGENKIKARFCGSGCSISQASASIMCELCKDRRKDEAMALYELFQTMMRGELSADDMKKLGDGAALAGVRQFPARIRCASLAWEALKQCLKPY